MNNFLNNKKAYISAIGSIITLVLVSTVILFMLNVNKKQQNSIITFKESLIDNRMNDRIALERIAGLYNKDLLFDLKEGNLDEDNILDFEDDIDKKFKIIDVSNNFGVKPRKVVLTTLDPEIDFSLNNNTKLTIEANLTQHYERLIDAQLDQGYGSYNVFVKHNGNHISPKDKDKEFESQDGSYHKIVFEEDEIQVGDYNVTRGEPGVYSDYNVYSGQERVEMKIEYTEINRLLKIIELDDDNNENNIYYLKLEDNSSLYENNEKSKKEKILVYFLNEYDLNELMSNKK